MAFKDGNSPSNGSKIALLLFTLTGVMLSMTIIFNSSKPFSVHSALLLTCTIVFCLRLAHCLLVFVKRKVSWFEGCLVGILYGVLVYMFSKWDSLAPDKSGVIDILGMILFVSGSWVNSQSDYQRDKWKKKPENAGHLYTEGLFRYAMHINFLGDTVMFVGYALVTQNGMSFIPVIAITLNFILLQIPRLDNYLQKKYGDEFAKYSQVTRKFIPFVY